MPTALPLRDRLSSGLKEAMRDKDVLRLSTLRLINAALKDREIALRAEGREVTDDDTLAILGKMVRQRQDSARAYEEAGRLELAERERAEIRVIEEYLPRKLTEREADEAVRGAIVETEAHSIRDVGRVMALLKSRYAGRMDFGAAGAQVKSRLSS